MTDRQRRLAALAIVLLALAASATSLGNGFAFDDEWIIRDNTRVHSISEAWKLFGQTYWPPANGSHLYRPFTMLGFAVQWSLGSGSTSVFHAGSLILYAAISLGVYALALALLPPAAAWIAAALFAVHPVHVEAVGNVVGQSELWVALSCVIAVWLYLCRRATGALSVRDIIALAALYAVAFLSKEHGVVLPALLAAAELLLVRDERPVVSRIKALSPLYVSLALVAAAILVVRGIVVGDVASDNPHIAFSPRMGGVRLFTVLGTVPEWVRLLLWPAHLSADYAPQHIPVMRGVELRVIFGASLLAAIAAIAFIAWRRGHRVVTFGIAWFAIAYLPVSNVLIPTGIVLAERTLLLPSVGAMLTIGAGASWLLAQRERLGPTGRVALASGLAIVLVAGVVRSAERQRVWRDSESVVRQTVLDAPKSYFAHYGYGLMNFRQGNKVVGERELRVALALVSVDPDVYVELANRYRVDGQCGPAYPLFRDALKNSPLHPDARAGLVMCLLQDARFPEARAEAQVGYEQGLNRPAFQRLLDIADSVMAARRVPSVPAPAPR